MIQPLLPERGRQELGKWGGLLLPSAKSLFLTETKRKPTGQGDVEGTVSQSGTSRGLVWGFGAKRQ